MTDKSELENFLESLPERQRKYFENLPEERREELLGKMMTSHKNLNDMKNKSQESVSPTKEPHTEEKTSSNIPEDLSNLSFDELFTLMSKTPKTDQEMGRKIAQALSRKMIAEGHIQSPETIEDELKKKYAEWLKKQEKLSHSESNEQTEALVTVPQEETALVIKQSEELQKVEQAQIMENTMSVSLYKTKEPRDNSQFDDAVILDEEPKGLPPHEAREEPVTPPSPSPAPHSQDEKSWIEKKREFWEEYAQKNNLTPTHDIGENNYSCELKDNEAKSKGFIHYESETSAQVSKDADLVMYQGLVKDAATNNLSISFGQSLDDKQKALLLAAILIHQNQENKKMTMVNEPTIDLNADYFKDLPEEAQKVLKDAKKAQNDRAKIEEKTSKDVPVATVTPKNVNPAAAVQKARGLLPVAKPVHNTEKKNNQHQLSGKQILMLSEKATSR